MEEVPLTFDVPSNKTVDVKGAKTITVKTSGHGTTHYTVVLSCCAEGTKLPPVLISKRKNMPEEAIPRGVIVQFITKDGWMDENDMKIRIEKMWSKRPGGPLKKPALLQLDQFRAHITEATKKRFKEEKTLLAIIPGGVTSQLQPLNVSIKPFTVFTREEWNKRMAAGNDDLTPTG